MEKSIKKSQSLYSMSTIICFILCFLLSFAGYRLYHQYFYSVMMVISLIGILFHIRYIYRLKKCFQQLITTCEMIIDQKEQTIQVIDGESYISVLSSHLYLLDIRMKAMLERLKQEQNHLKTYIEDISHQIKTPITAMLLKEDILLEISDDKSKHLVEQMIYQTQKVQQCIESLLQLAQIESHSIVYNPQLCLFDDLLITIQDNLLPLLEKHDVSLISEGETELIYGDFQWLSTAIENIIKNCIEQKDHSYINIKCEKHPSFHKIIIHDHGEGIRKEDLSHLFDRFYRSEFQKDHHGIGIGLSITKGIIDDHHGNIHVYNDHGAVFEITLPLKKTKSKFTVTNE